MTHLILSPDTIPAPHSVQYALKNDRLCWSPPPLDEIFDNDNINIALRITHYIIYVTDIQTGLTTNFTTTGLETSTVIPTMPCSMLIEVSAVNPARESHRSTSVIIDCEQYSCLVIRCKL